MYAQLCWCWGARVSFHTQHNSSSNGNTHRVHVPLRWGHVVENVYIEPFLSSSGPLASIMEIYSFQIWRPASYNLPERRVVTVSNDTGVKSQPDDAVMARVPVANDQVGLS